MRKIIAFLLALVLLLSLAACSGSREETVKESETASATVAPTEAPTEAPIDAPNTEPPATESDPNDFDKTWAGEDLEMPIPAPPFTAEVEYEADRGTYDIRSTDVDEIIATDIQEFKDYCETLKAIGFVDSLREGELEAGDYTGYEFYAERNGNQSVMLIHDGRSCMMFVIVQE